MKRKNGFTLIELLAVIVILAIIALIAVPVIMNILNKANKSAFKDSAYGLISAGELYFAEQQLDLEGMNQNVTFTFPTDKIDIKGEIPAGTVLKVNTEGDIALAMSNGRYCVTKGFIDADITIVEDAENCYIPYTLTAVATTNSEVTSIPSCLSDGTKCAIGTEFAIKVNNTQTYKFNVLSDDGDKITLMMSTQLFVSNWYFSNNNSYGPLTVIENLDRATDKWNNIPKLDYTYSGLSHDGKRFYEDITRNMRARMITFSEVNATKNGQTIPTWVYSGSGNWTSTPNVSATGQPMVWNVRDNGSFSHNGPNSNRGVRPVIELTR